MQLVQPVRRLEELLDVFVFGLASASSAVKINGVDTITRTGTDPWGPTPIDRGLPFRQGEYFSGRLQADNSSGPDWLEVTVQAGAVSQTGHLYHPPAAETLTYDLDGNLTGDGQWTYVWDGENRLVGMTTKAAAVLAGVPDLKLIFSYDAQSRRIRKVVEHAVGVGSWQLDSDTRFAYDGWNLLAEIEMHNTSAGGRAKDAPAGVEGPYVRRSFMWGPDVSCTLQGAGGVGGLLAVRRHARGTQETTSYWAAWDLNGNVIGLLRKVGRDTTVATYEYDPFGKPLRVSEPEEDLKPFRFSTKYTDAETGLCYYGYRYYDALRGRWINRDPIREEGGVNLYGMLGNSAVDRWDLLGQAYPSGKSQPNPNNLPKPGSGIIAGAEVRGAIDVTLKRIDEVFWKTWTESKRCQRCNIIVSYPEGVGQWDLHGVKYPLTGDFAAQGTTKEGLKAKYTVTFRGEVWLGSTVAYALWGRANKLCSKWAGSSVKWSLGHALSLTGGYKFWQESKSRLGMDSYEVPFVDFDGAQQFTRYGHNGAVPARGSSTGTYYTRNIHPNRLEYPRMELSWQWGGYSEAHSSKYDY